MEPDRPKAKDKKAMFSTSLPKGLWDSLQKATVDLHRKKTDWVRASLYLFFCLVEEEQESQVLDSYKKIEISHLRPFTTTLLESQLNSLNKLSKALNRSKADIVRSAIFVFLSRSAKEQEKEIKKSLSR